MKIYTGNAFGKKLDKIVEHNLGIMISTHPKTMPSKEYKLRKIPCALDNGAFSAYTKGYPFPNTAFLKTLDKCFELGIKLDFIVCPDIVGGGKKSLEFSLEWADGKLKTAPNLALVVQDDAKTIETPIVKRQHMSPELLLQYDLTAFKFIFLGGTLKWKWNSLEMWAEYCKENNLWLHVGRCGRLEKMVLCHSLGVDSIDSTSFARNESWHIIEKYRKETGDS